MSFRFVNHSVDLDIYEYSGSLGWPHIIVLLMINAVIESSSDKHRKNLLNIHSSKSRHFMVNLW